MRALSAVGSFLFALFCAGSAAYADGTYVKEGGGLVVPMSNDEVAMLWETVDLDVERPHLMADDDDVRVTVTYRFKNTTDREITVAMGFPVAWDSWEHYVQGANRLDKGKRSPVSEFTTTVDGQPVPVRLRPAKEVRAEAGRRRALKDKRFSEFQVWDVTFAPGQERTVVNRYLYDAHSAIYWSENELVYILSTGRAWKGPIGRATIRLRLHDKGCLRVPGDSEGCITGEAKKLGDDPFRFGRGVPKSDNTGDSITPDGAKVHTLPDGTLETVWELRRIEPDTDVHLSYQTALTVRHSILALLQKINLAKASPTVLRNARSYLLALYGLRFEDPAEAARFAKRSFYLLDPTMTLPRIRQYEPLLDQIDAKLAAHATAPENKGAPPPPKAPR